MPYARYLIAFLGSFWLSSPLAAHPFGTGFSEDSALPASDGLLHWFMIKQAALQEVLYQMAFNVGANSQTMLAFWSLCLLYGILHAIGPGHGKAVLSAYLFAHGQRLRQSLILSFAAALLQGLIAIAIVGIIIFFLNATASYLRATDHWVELIAYFAIIAVGTWLTLIRGWRLLKAIVPPDVLGQFRFNWSIKAPLTLCFVTPSTEKAPSFLAHTPPHETHTHTRGCCGHHALLVAPVSPSWSQTLSTIIAAGLRPCSGAILILTYTASQNVFWIGVIGVMLMSAGTAVTTAGVATLSVFAKTWLLSRLSHTSRWHVIAARLLEFLAAVLVLIFGLTLLIILPQSG
jgi:nickel/cobalt exporter